jgi:transcription antitermination factor NusG
VLSLIASLAVFLPVALNHSPHRDFLISTIGGGMPILALEPQLFPPGLFETEEMESNAPRAWWVLHTRPRQEKSLARELYASEVPFFLPLTPRQTRVRNRVMTAHLPLFTSYLFLCADQEERIAALASSRVVGSIRVADQQQLVRDLAQIRRLIQLGAPVAAENRMVPGAIVEIQCGPLAGLRGKIVQEATQKRFIVEVDFIQRGASVLLDGNSLMPVGTCTAGRAN